MIRIIAFAAASIFLLPGCPNSVGITCPLGQTFCNGKCIFANTDANNCGACGKVCPSTLACINGSCGCPGALANCANICSDTNVDPAHCGSCGNACAADLVCNQGACALHCSAGLTNCNGACVDENNDPNNCGMCGRACGPNHFCVSGSCQFDCPPPFAVCTTANGPICVDENDDPNNCGGCGVVCPGGTINASGMGVTQGQICCGGVCLIPNTTNHCSSCQPCPSPQDTCSSGFCILG